MAIKKSIYTYEGIKKTYVRRGFDIEINNYNEFRSLAMTLGLKTKDLLDQAMRREIRVFKKKMSHRKNFNGIVK